jgi:ferredoxin
MADAMRVTKVWINSGCIECRWCHDLAPDVFAIGEGTSVIRSDARVDGATDSNESAKAALAAPFEGQMAEFIEFVAAGCPTSVIKIETEVTADDLTNAQSG